MAADNDPSEQLSAWQRAPDRSAAGAVVGLAASWLVGAYLIAGMVAPPGADAPVSGTEFLLWMLGPVTVATAACTNRRVRWWAGAFAPGVIAGWILGLLSFALLASLALIF